MYEPVAWEGLVNDDEAGYEPVAWYALMSEEAGAVPTSAPSVYHHQQNIETYT